MVNCAPPGIVMVADFWQDCETLGSFRGRESKWESKKEVRSGPLVRCSVDQSLNYCQLLMIVGSDPLTKLAIMW